jgi:SecD/SecF fusion protein
VLLPIGSLLLFGGQTLKDFAFALFIGVAAGTYSSIFIAAPLLTILKEREPEYARRKDVVEVAGDGRAAELVLEEAEEAAAAEPAPDLSPVDAVERVAASAEAKRERRRQRRRARPHGRTR